MDPAAQRADGSNRVRLARTATVVTAVPLLFCFVQATRFRDASTWQARLPLQMFIPYPTAQLLFEASFEFSAELDFVHGLCYLRRAGRGQIIFGVSF